MNELLGQSGHGVVPSYQEERSQVLRPRSLLEAIEANPLVLDAGMGTRLLALGLDPRSDDPALWNLSRPRDVLAIHERDVAAGAAAVLTNTFGASRFWLKRFGREAMFEPVNRSAVALARGAAGPGRFVIGDIGPAAAREEGDAAQQAAILVDAGAAALILETFRFPEAERVLREIRRSLAGPIPLLASLWEWPDDPIPAACRLRDAGANVLGMNCQPGIEAAVAFAVRLGRHAGCPLLVKPSAGTPGRSGAEPAAFAAAVPDLVDHNVRLLGGCCGTSEAHVAALAAACAKLGPLIPSSAPRGGES